MPRTLSQPPVLLFADEACCDQLAALQPSFSSNLPVVIIDTFGVQLTRDKVNASLCTCSTLHKGDYAGEVEVSLRGGQTTRAAPPLLPVELAERSSAAVRFLQLA